MPQNMGIYRIINIVNGKFYLGSSNNLRKRKREHIWALRRGTHINNYLQKAFDKYGENNFRFEVLEYVENEEDLRKIEQKYLDLYKPYIRSIGYNLCEDSRGGGLSGEKNPNYQKPMSIEQRLAISRTLKGHPVPLEVRLKISMAKRGKYTGEKHPMYGKPVPLERRKRHSEIMKGRYSGRKNPFYGKTHSEEARAKMSNAHKGKTGAQCPNSIKIVQLTKEGTILKIFDAMHEAQRETGIWASNIQKCCKGELKTAGGYKWMYYDDYIAV